MISKCPDETLLVEYASGSLSTAPSIAVTTHLKYCDKCRNAVSALGFLGGSLLECLEEEEVSEGWDCNTGTGGCWRRNFSVKKIRFCK